MGTGFSDKAQQIKLKESGSGQEKNGGEGGIRTHGTDVCRYNRLAGDPVQPLQHLSAEWWRHSTCFAVGSQL